MRAGLVIVLLALVGLVDAACYPVYAPPARTDMAGAPARLAVDQGDIHGSASIPTPMGGSGDAVAGGGGIAIPLGRAYHLEGGFDLGGEWAMGHLGLRQSYGFEPPDTSGTVMDVEGGIGLGVGGIEWAHDPECCDGSVQVGPPWRERIAGGGYFGGGVGHRIKDIITPFTRVRFQLTGAQETPMTFWWDVVGGIEAHPRPWGFSIFFAASLSGYANEEDGSFWPSLHAGASLAFPFRGEGGHSPPDW